LNKGRSQQLKDQSHTLLPSLIFIPLCISKITMSSQLVSLLNEIAPRWTILQTEEELNRGDTTPEDPQDTQLRKVRMQALESLLPVSQSVMQYGNEDVEDKLANDFKVSALPKHDGYPDYAFFKSTMEELLDGLLSNDEDPLKGCETLLMRRADRGSNITPGSPTQSNQPRFAFLLRYFRCLAQISVQEDSEMLGSYIAMMWQRIWVRIHEHENSQFVLDWWRALEWAVMKPEDVHGTVLT